MKINNSKSKLVVVTGGVLSGLGKGVLSASIGALLKDTFKVVPIKCDGYLNADTGTMNPIEHGEVFVLDDGGEVDMDFGHYERFIGITAKRDWNITMGKVYQQILINEREGKYLGQTVQLIPHATDEIKRRIYRIIEEESPQVVLIEIGGTVGDIENELFIDAIRQIRNEIKRENSLFIHLTYVPFLTGSKEFKSKPTQNSIKLLHKSGIYPDAVVCRSSHYLSEPVRKKISLHCDIDEESVFSGIDVENINELPLYFEQQGMAKLFQEKLNLKVSPLSKKNQTLIRRLKKLVKTDRSSNQTTSSSSTTGKSTAGKSTTKKSSTGKSKSIPTLNIVLYGKYTHLEDSYASINETLQHCSAHCNVSIRLKFLNVVKLNQNSKDKEIKKILAGIDGVIVPGGFGTRGTEGKIRIIRYVRENKIPFLGICLGMQLAVVEYARNVCQIKNAHTREKKGLIENPVIEYLPNQKEYLERGGLGGTMRLGGHDVLIKHKTKAYRIYQAPKIRKRFRHRYEVNPSYVAQLEEHGLIFSGTTIDKKIMQIIELGEHPFFMASQFHPELISSLESPSKIFLSFVKSMIKLSPDKES